MRRRLVSALLILCLLAGLLPAAASAVSLSSADQNAISELLSYYEWFGADYNCTNPTVSTKNEWKRDLLMAVVIHPACVRLSSYPVTVREYWSKADPKGRWDSHSEISSADANWLLKNIFHCTDIDIAAMRSKLASARYAYYQNGVYYAALYGVGDGYEVKNMQISQYGKLYLVRFQTYVYPNDYLHTRYAVVGKENIGGKDYWSLYYWNETKPSDTGFLDVDDNAYYAPSVYWAVDRGVTNGVSDYAFAPGRSCSRAQAVTFLWRAAGCPAPGSTACPFKDVSSNAYYYTAMLWAVENGITKGVSADRFAPDQTCTRAQIVTFLYRAAGSPEVSGSRTFSDVPAGAYYEKAVRWAVANKITTGTSETRFSPNANCTRAQMVTFLQRFLANSEIRPAPARWLGTFVASTGEKIVVTDVTSQGVTLIHWVLTESGESYVNNTFTLDFVDTDKNRVTRPYMTSNPSLEYIYTLDGDAIILTESFTARVKTFYRQN